MVDKQNKVKRVLRGQVVSDKMDKTIVVEVERIYKHPKLQKVMRASKKYKVHDDAQLASVGDVVDIFEGRPVSKTKYMYLDRVVETKNNK